MGDNVNESSVWVAPHIRLLDVTVSQPGREQRAVTLVAENSECSSVGIVTMIREGQRVLLIRLPACTRDLPFFPRNVQSGFGAQSVSPSPSSV